MVLVIQKHSPFLFCKEKEKPLEIISFQGRRRTKQYVCFSHPDYNRRLGIEPIMPFGSQTCRCKDLFTAGGEFHSALKQNSYKFDNHIIHHECGLSISSCEICWNVCKTSSRLLTAFIKSSKAFADRYCGNPSALRRRLRFCALSG